MQQNTHLRNFICPLTLYVLLLLPFKSSGVESFDAELSELTDTVATAIDKAELKGITVADFTDLRGEVSQLGRFLADEVSTGLVLAQKKFTVVDRANLKRIMDEYKLTMSGLVDPENVKKLGQLAGVDAIVIGTLTPMTNSVRVTIKVLATDSAKLVGAARGDLSRTGSIQELLGDSRDSGEPSQKIEPDKVAGAQSETPKRRKPIALGPNVIATLDSVKVLNDKTLEIYVSFENAAGSEIAIYLGYPVRFPAPSYQNLQAFATDNSGAEYNFTSLGGVTAFAEGSSGAYLIYKGTNQYVTVPAHDKSQVRFAFGPKTNVTDKPTTINFTAELRILSDLKSKRMYDKTLNVLNCPVD
jgi:TolB-like protein